MGIDPLGEDGLGEKTEVKFGGGRLASKSAHGGHPPCHSTKDRKN